MVKACGKKENPASRNLLIWLQNTGLLGVGGADGTRTRDPLRDRQVF